MTAPDAALRDLADLLERAYRVASTIPAAATMLLALGDLIEDVEFLAAVVDAEASQPD
jgi:hypothetical protein